MYFRDHVTVLGQQASSHSLPIASPFLLVSAAFAHPIELLKGQAPCHNGRGIIWWGMLTHTLSA